MMKHLRYFKVFIILICISSKAFSFSPPLPKINVLLQNRTSYKVDTLFVICENGLITNYTNDQLTKKITAVVDQKSKFHFQVKLENNKSLVSSTLIRKTEKYDGYIVEINDENIKVKLTNKYVIYHYILLFLFVSLFVFCFKILLYMHFFKPIKKGIYIFKYTFLNTLTFFLAWLIVYYLMPKNFYLYLWLFLIPFTISFILDYILHKYDRNVLIEKKVKVIAMVNVFIFTTGFLIAAIVYFYLIDI